MNPMIAFRLSIALSISLVSGFASAAEPAAPSRLRLRDETALVGTIAPSPDPKVLRWQSPSFVTPFEFPIEQVNGVHFPIAPGKVNPQGTFGFELAGGNLLYGDLLSISPTEVVVKLASQPEPIRIDRGIVHRLFRQVDDSSLVYLGPTGLEGWTQVEPKEPGVFTEETGQIVASAEGVITGDIKLPELAACEIEISWKGDADFTLDLGGSSQGGKGGLRIEAVEQFIVAVRETPTDADLIPLQAAPPGEGRLRLLAFIDQSKPQILLFSPTGDFLGELAISEKTSGPWGVRLTNRKGTVRLERLRISNWNGSRPQEVVASKSRMHRTNGAIEYGAIEAFDAGEGVFIVRGDQGELRVPVAEVKSVYLSEVAPVEFNGISVTGLDGTRLSGALLGIDATTVRVQPTGVKDPVSLPIERIRSLLVVGPPREAQTPTAGAIVGTMQVADQFIRGWLVDGRKGTDIGCLVWKPQAALNAVALRTGVSGRVVYKEPPPAPSQAELQRRQQLQIQQQQQQGAVLNAGQRMVQALAGKFAQPGGAAKGAAQPLLHLRTGDTISCKSVVVTETGVEIESDTTDAKKISHERIKVLELVPSDPNDVKLKKSKKERLLTLPRIQRPSPPTQLLRATSGDFLRGRVTAMDAEKIQLEVRLENREVPRKLVSHIFWLHPDELDPKAAPPQAVVTEGRTRVQAYRNDGFRLTFDAEELAGGTLSGTSEILGACRIELAKIDQLMIGQGIEQAVAQLAYHRWRLKNAVDPKFASEGDGDDEGGRNTGTESNLVGKPAPDFTLALLDQEASFKLSDQKGKIVVLDFWATWCGPCVRAMPMVEAAVRDFPEDKVRLVAVNLQEQPKQIKSMLERHKLDVTVALDIDGVVAERYEASAIPQTVIIDRDGKIVRLFVGGSNDLGDQIKSTINDLLGVK